MPQLHPAVENLLHSGRFICRPRVEGFTEHELKNNKGDVVRKVTRADLEQFAKVNNAKAENGALSPIGPGHTFDDVYDDKGQLIRKFPEKDQPKPFGYLYNYRVELNPHTGKYSLFHDEWIQRTIVDPDTGKEVDGLQYSATFPRRSAEAYHNEHWIDWMAALRRAPRLDLGLQAYANTNPHHTFYAMDAQDKPMPACVMARGKTRYSFDTGGEMDDPTKPPSATPTASTSVEGDTSGAGGAGGQADPPLPEEHAHAAERYAHHVSGMHHTRFKRLLGHLHQKYAAECGMPGDMNAEYAMGTPSATNAVPSPGAAATPQAPATPSKEEPTRMQQDQAAIEKERYEKRVKALEDGLAEERALRVASQEQELHSRYERELLQLVFEGYSGIDAEKELEFVKSRKYSRQQFDDHIGILRRLPKSLTTDIPPLHDMTRNFRHPGDGDPNDQNALYEKNYETIIRYIRQGMTNAAAYEKATGKVYETNGHASAK